MNGLLDILKDLKQTGVRFLTTPAVKREVYDRPLHIQQFELGAVRINALIQQGILEMPEVMNIKLQDIEKQTRYLLDCINKAYRADGETIQLVSEAEVSCMALALQLQKQDHTVMMAVDERTARLLCEKPDNIQKLMEQKLHRPVTFDKRCVEQLKTIKCIRSPELVYVAYKKSIIKLNQPQALEALLYATKFKGSAISWDEINILKKL